MITKLPKSMWLMNAAILAGMLLSGIAATIGYLIGSDAPYIVAIVIVVLSWSVAVGAWIFNMVRQARGAYRNIKPAPFREQIW